MINKLYLLLLTAVLAVGCHNVEQPTIQDKNNIYVSGFEIITIDSCQYIYKLDAYAGSVIAHKGNCNNPIHKR